MKYTKISESKLFRFAAMALAGTLALTPPIWAVESLPQNPTVVEGDATVGYTPLGVEVYQTTENLKIEWESFNIAQDFSVFFHQPSVTSWAWNFVTGGSVSNILGSLQANGNVALINPAGIMFGAQATVNAAGFLASTLNVQDVMRNADLNQTLFNLMKDPNKENAFIVNKGRIEAADGGSVTLAGGAVQNEGTIIAKLGKVNLASGEKMTLELDSQGTMSIAVEGAVTGSVLDESGEALNAAVSNAGTLASDGGIVTLNAQVLKDLFKNAVNNDGVIQANAVENRNGEIYIVANDRVHIGGEVTAEGGTVSVSSEGAYYDGTITAAAGIFNANDGDTFLSGIFNDGNKQFRDNGNITVVGDVTVNNGTLVIKADNNNSGGGDFFQNPGTVITTTGSNKKITIRSGSSKNNGTGNVTVGAVNATGDLEITAPGGYIHRNSDELGLASGRKLVLIAQSLGESGHPLVINNTGALKEATTVMNGGIFINALSGLTIEDLNPNGSETVINSSAGNLATTKNINTGGGSLTLTSTGDLTIGNGGGDDITAGAGSVTLTADSDGDGTGSFLQNPDTTISTDSNIAIRGADAALGNLQAGGDVSLEPSFADQTIGLGGGTGNFNLTDAELDNVDLQGTLSIGNLISGDISVGELTQSGKNLAVLSGADMIGEAADVDLSGNPIPNIASSSLSFFAPNGSVSGAYQAGENPGYFVTQTESLDAEAQNAVRVFDIGSGEWIEFWWGGRFFIALPMTLNNITVAGGAGSVDIVSTNDMHVGFVSDPVEVRLESLAGEILGLEIGADEFGNLIPNIETPSLTLRADNGRVYGVRNPNPEFVGGYLLTRVGSLDAEARDLVQIWDLGTELWNEDLGGFVPQIVHLNNVVTQTGGFPGIDIVTTFDMGIGHISEPFDVRLESLQGSIVGQNLSSGAPADINSLMLQLFAGDSIYGSHAPEVFYPNNTHDFLTTNVTVLDAAASNSIDIYNTGFVFLGLVEASGNASIDIVADGDIFFSFISDPQHVTLEARDGSIVSQRTGLTDIETGSLSLFATGDIYGLGAFGFDHLVTQVDTLNVQAGNLIMIHDVGVNPVTLQNAVATGADFTLISIIADSDLNVGFVSDSAGFLGFTDLTSTFGAIHDANGDELNIVTGDLILSANSGIGSLEDALETQVFSLWASNGASGDINISNHSPAGLTIFGAGLTNFGGDILLTEGSPLTIDAPVSAFGSIRLSAEDTTPGANDGDMFVNADVVSTTGDVELSAHHDIVQDTSRIRAKNDVTIAADSESNGFGDFRQATGIIKNGDVGDVSVSGSGVLVKSIASMRDIFINAENDIAFSRPDSALFVLEAARNVDLTAQNGALIDRNNSILDDIAAESAILRAQEGIGSENPLETVLSNLSAQNTSDGNIFVNNTGDLVLANLDGFGAIINTALGGAIGIGAASDLTVDGPVETNGGGIALSASESIIQTENGAVEIRQTDTSLSDIPTELESTSHPIGELAPGVSTDNTIDVRWQLPASREELGDFTANAGNAYTMHPDSSIRTNGGDAAITAGQDVSLALVDASNGNVNVVSNTGNILDSGSGEVTGRSIQLVSPNGTVDDIDFGFPAAAQFTYDWQLANPFAPPLDEIGDPFTAVFDADLATWLFSPAAAVPLGAGDNWFFGVASLGSISPTAFLGPFFIVTIPSIAGGLPSAGAFELGLLAGLLRFVLPTSVQDLGTFQISQTLGQVFFYHPLLEMTMYDMPGLGTEAYEFIDNNISFTNPALLPFLFGEEEEEEKKEKPV